jgi:leukotriene-A4 hydrolase
MHKVVLVCLVGLLAACHAQAPSSPSTPQAPARVVRDVFSHARPEEVRVTHLALDVTLDFAGKKVDGSVTLSFERPDPAAPLRLDSQDLAIAEVRGADGKPRHWQLGEASPGLGAELAVTLEPGDRSVTIRYATGAAAEALQWLEPAQTRDGKAPFLFTQGQAILTRTWIPMQDSPGVRVTYDATVRAPEGLTVLMSAEQLGKGKDGAWHFRMQEAIPVYLVALAAGVLEFRAISARSGIWAEPSLVQAARDELVDTEAMIQAAEALWGPYRWGRYDVLVLPPSFPYGGMENPRLTFATPTVLAGDKSLVSLIAHELAHSWSGNLVTNATWRDSWLNEGFTTYCEQRIVEQVFGVERSLLERELDWHSLQDELAELEPWQEVLHVNLDGRGLDEGFSGIEYQKGALFLRTLEVAYGRDAFDRFLRGYFDAHAFQSITTEDFVAWLRAKLMAGAPPQVDVDAWLEQPGLPADAPQAKSARLAAVGEQYARLAAGAAPSTLDTHGWVTQEWQRFIQLLPEDVPVARLAQLDAAFHFTATQNREILCDWLVLGLRRGYPAVDARVEEFLMNVGRTKFVRRLYAELMKTPEGAARAKAIYAKARPRYHAATQGSVDRVLAGK